MAIRSGDWALRTATLKKMVPTFTAFNHYHYTELIGKHLADIVAMPDILAMPECITTMFRQGAFVASICGTPWQSVAVDECHETMINKSCKMSVVRPSEEYLNRVIHYLPTRAKALENLNEQLSTTDKGSPVASIVTTSSRARKHEDNITALVKAMRSMGYLLSLVTTGVLPTTSPMRRLHPNKLQTC